MHTTISQSLTQDATDRETDNRKSVLRAIEEGDWDYEPHEVPCDQYASTGALPGSREKLGVLADRASSGLPLWHDGDRRTYDDPEAAP